MTGVLLVNVGTPDAPRPPEVRRYLRQFLGDPRVLDMNPAGRALLLNAVILPFRPKQSAHAYAQVWTDEGSPLLVLSRRFEAALAGDLGPDYKVALGMRYGTPSLAGALDALRTAGADPIVVFPLYPQYASSTTGTSLEEVYRLAGRPWNVPHLSVVPPFYDDPGMVGAFAARARPVLEEIRADHLLMSFHGLPERQILKSDPTGTHCLSGPDCCATAPPGVLATCYRAQCRVTAREIAAALGLPADRWSVSFQSRLGRIPWIRPYTDEVLKDLAGRGVKRLAVACPAFVADCLETLEEIAMRGKETFLAAGGEAYALVPSLNDHPAWVAAAAALVRHHTAEAPPREGPAR